MKLQENIVDGSKLVGKNLAKIVLIASLAIASVVEKSQAQVINKQAGRVERVEKVRRRSGAEQLQDPNQTPEQFLEENKNLKLSPERIKYINEKYRDEWEENGEIDREYNIRLFEDPKYINQNIPLQDFFDICILSSQNNYKGDNVAFISDSKKIRNINPLILLKNLKKISLNNNPNLQNLDALRLMKDRFGYLSLTDCNLTSLEHIRKTKAKVFISVYNRKVDPKIFRNFPPNMKGIYIGKEIASLYEDFFTKELLLKKYIQPSGDSLFKR